MDTHIYLNHVSGVKKQLTQKIYNLPKLETTNFKSIFEWNHEDSNVLDYKCSDAVKFEVAI